MCDIVLPACFEELLHANEENAFFIENKDIDLPESDIEATELIEDLLQIDFNEENDITIPQSKIDTIFILVSKMDQLSNSNKNLLTEVLSDLTSKCITFSESPGITQSQKNGIKITFYFFLVVCSKFEAVAKKVCSFILYLYYPYLYVHHS